MNGSTTASTSDRTQTESNRALARRFFQDVWNDRRDETIDELLDPEIVAHMEGAEFTGTGPYKETRRNLLQAFADLRVTVEDTAADGDHVVVRWAASGTHNGAGLGFAATNRSVSFRGMTWLTFREGIVVEGWDAWNLGALLETLDPR